MKTMHFFKKTQEHEQNRLTTKRKGTVLDGIFFLIIIKCVRIVNVHMTTFWTLNSIMQFTELHKEFRKNYFFKKGQGFVNKVDYE